MVWLYLGFFNFSNPVLWSYTSEVQTFTMRSKGLLLWNQINQLCGAYTTWVDSIALGKIGECGLVTLVKNFHLRGIKPLHQATNTLPSTSLLSSSNGD